VGSQPSLPHRNGLSEVEVPTLGWMATGEFPIEALIFLLAAMFVYEASFFVGCDAVALVGGS